MLLRAVFHLMVSAWILSSFMQGKRQLCSAFQVHKRVPYILRAHVAFNSMHELEHLLQL